MCLSLQTSWNYTSMTGISLTNYCTKWPIFYWDWASILKSSKILHGDLKPKPWWYCIENRIAFNNITKQTAGDKKTKWKIENESRKKPRTRASRGTGPLRLRREKRALKRSDMGWVGSSNRSQRNFSVSGDDSKPITSRRWSCCFAVSRIGGTQKHRTGTRAVLLLPLRFCFGTRGKKRRLFLHTWQQSLFSSHLIKKIKIPGKNIWDKYFLLLLLFLEDLTPDYYMKKQ